MRVSHLGFCKLLCELFRTQRCQGDQQASAGFLVQPGNQLGRWMLLLNNTLAFQEPKLGFWNPQRLASTESPNILQGTLLSTFSPIPNLKNLGHLNLSKSTPYTPYIPFHIFHSIYSIPSRIIPIMARKASSVLRPLGLSRTITSSVAEITGGRRGGNNLGSGSPTSSREA